MKLTFYGAAGEVTGSCYLLETDRARILIDFGMIQGDDAARRNHLPPPLDAPNVSAVVLTHAHIDHSGRLPMLEAAGFERSVYATPATIDLTRILLEDSAKIQAEDAAEAQRHGRDGFRPLYMPADVEGMMKRFTPLPYRREQEIAPGVRLRFRDAGHILGSASVELMVEERGRTRAVVFSGDLGPKGAPLLHDPDPPDRADVLVMESTYGDRDHRSPEATLAEFAGVLNEAAKSKGKVLIPAFAVGRTQNLLYLMGQMRRDGRLAATPVVLDSPMAIEATELYRRHRDLFDDEAWAIISSGETPLSFQGLQYARTVEQSKRIDDLQSAVVIAASGMMQGGRIVHHLKHNLGRPQTHLLIVGYQAEGTLGRRLVDGARHVKVLGDPITVQARRHTIGGLSAHAGRSGLVEWAAAIRGRPARLFLTHGEDAPRRALRDALLHEIGIEATLPAYGQSVEL